MHGSLASWERGPLARNALMTLLKQILHCLQLPKTAIVPTPPMLNEYFGVGVTSEPRMASAGVEPWMGSSTDKHLLRSTACTKLSLLIKQTVCTPCLTQTKNFLSDKRQARLSKPALLFMFCHDFGQVALMFILCYLPYIDITS